MDLYYYTTAETMRFILTKGDIFATHISYLNDSEEYINGLRELKNLLQSGSKMGNRFKEVSDRYLNEETYNDAVKNVPELYSISFSKEPDLLSQWYMYSKESGIRLKMAMPDREEISFKVEKIPEQQKKTEKRDITGNLKSVHYFTRIGMEAKEYNKERKNIFGTIENYIQKQGIENDIEGNIIRIWKDIAPYIKNYEFRQEKEVRLIFRADANVDLIYYRNSKGVLIPYLDIYSEEGWPVTEIMVGPGRNQERVYSSICHFVEHADLKIPKIEEERNAEAFLKGMQRYQISQKNIKRYREKIKNSMQNQNIISHRDAIYDCLKDAGKQEYEYLSRNFYSKCGIIVRKSNAPYEF